MGNPHLFADLLSQLPFKNLPVTLSVTDLKCQYREQLSAILAVDAFSKGYLLEFQRSSHL